MRYDIHVAWQVSVPGSIASGLLLFFLPLHLSEMFLAGLGVSQCVGEGCVCTGIPVFLVLGLLSELFFSGSSE